VIAVLKGRTFAELQAGDEKRHRGQREGIPHPCTAIKLQEQLLCVLADMPKINIIKIKRVVR
jgi:hypothetical protein